MKKIIIPLVLIGALTFAMSCKKGLEPENKKNPEELTVQNDTLVELKTFLAKEYGAKLSEVYFDRKDESFIVQGDIGVDKTSAERLFKESLKIPKLSSDKNTKLPGISQRQAVMLYSTAVTPIVRVKNSCTTPAWKTAASAAIKNYDHASVKTLSDIRMVEVYGSPFDCEITETGGPDPVAPYDNHAIGQSPIFGAYLSIPGTFVKVYTNGNGNTADKKELVITHELGHVIGFKHNGDYGAGTAPVGNLPGVDQYSYMNEGNSQWASSFDGFSDLDLRAMAIMYPRTVAPWVEKLNITGINLAAGNSNYLYQTSNTTYPDGNRLFIRWNFGNNSWQLMIPGRKGIKMALAGNGQYYFITADKKIYKDAYPNPILMPGEAIDIAANDVGELFIVSNTVLSSAGNQIKKWNGWSSWTNYSTHPAKAIALGPGYEAKPIIINNFGYVSFFVTDTGVSGQSGVDATSIAVANSVLDASGNRIIYITDKTGITGTTNYPIKRWTGRDWHTLNFSGTTLAVDYAGHPWTITNTGQVYSHPTY
ncbi:MAG TPA: M57 family metalloprotease [Pedobacter sp.]|nr:M57 family metalloprotease [Pedobacter sp.]